MADKAFPTLQDEAKNQLALQMYIRQLEHPQVSFGVKQKQPSMLDEAVTVTLEMEGYLQCSGVQTSTAVACQQEKSQQEKEDKPKELLLVAAVEVTMRLGDMMKHLMD